MFIPEIVSSIFTSDEELISIASKGFRIVVFFYPIVGFQMVASNFFQSIGMASKAIFLSLTRQMLFLVPCLFYLTIMDKWAFGPVCLWQIWRLVLYPEECCGGSSGSLRKLLFDKFVPIFFRRYTDILLEIFPEE